MGIFGNSSNDKSTQGYVNAAKKTESSRTPLEQKKVSDASNIQAVRNADFEAKRIARIHGDKKK